MVILIVILAISAAAAAFFLYAGILEPNWLRVRRRVLFLPKWDPRLDGLTILHLSDLHIAAGPSRAERFLRAAKNLRADLTLFTGDFIADPSGMNRACRALREFCDGRKVFGIPGNHEYTHYLWHFPGKGKFKARSALDTGPIFQALEEAGVPLLVNRRVTVEHGGARFVLAGIGDSFNDDDDLGATLDGVDAGSPVVLMAHSPDILGDAARRGVALVLSGHAHGGQVHIPLLGTPTTGTRLPMERPSGVIRRASTVMHVSPGLGTTFLPVRFFARPEITLLELRTASSV